MALLLRTYVQGLRNEHRVPRLTDKEIEAALPQYEGLIYTTARRIDCVIELPFEDIASELRMKALKALRKYDSERSNVTQKVFVGHAIINRKKDLLRDDKGQKRQLVYIEDMREWHPLAGSGARKAVGDNRTDMDYFSVGQDEVYEEIERETPLIPSTLTDVERHVLVMLYDDHTILDIQRAVGIKRQDVKDAIEAIKVKFADWRPGGRPEIVKSQHLQAA